MPLAMDALHPPATATGPLTPDFDFHQCVLLCAALDQSARGLALTSKLF